MQVLEIHIHVVNNVVDKTQLFVNLETIQLSVDLSDVKVVSEDVTVANFMQLTHHFGPIVAQIFDVHSCVFSLLSNALLKRFQNQHIPVECALYPFV